MEHELFLRRCLDLAAKGAGLTAPNPMVGAVLVHNNRIIGEGYHQEFGGAHAEVNAIHSVSESDRHLIAASTLYVNLEPCNHFGKTPPCSELIIANKIPRVVIGSRDPNHMVSGGGIQRLKNAGIEVILPVLEDECLQLNKFFYCFHTKNRPYITIKWAESDDHFIAEPNGVPIHFTNLLSDHIVQKLRAEHMSIFAGGRTLLNDDPRLTNRSGSGKQPLRITLDTKNNLPVNLQFFSRQGNAIVFNYAENKTNENIEYIQIEAGENNIPQILQLLFLKNINSILVEGGTETIRAFLKSAVWDEILVFSAPVKLINGIVAPEPAGQFIESIRIDDNTLNRYRNA